MPPSDADREARARAQLADVLARLAESPDDLELHVQARRLRGVVEAYAFLAHMCHHALRWALHQADADRRN